MATEAKEKLMYQERFMKEAVQLATNNVTQGDGGPFGALVVKDGNVIARGVNLVTSTNDPTNHAEVVAIRRACEVLKSFQLTDCDLYTSCEPCPMCLGAIFWARVRTVFFANTRKDAAAIGFDDSMIYQQISVDPGKRVIPFVKVEMEEALSAFNAWRDKTDKVTY